MPRVTVIDSSERRILLWDGTAVRAIPYDPYHGLKYRDFDGNRIFHAFGGDRRLRVEETYNDGIFNAYMTPRGDAAADTAAADAPAEMVAQIPDAIGIAEAVLEDDAGAFERIFRHWYGKHMQSEIVDYLMVAGNSHRVRAVPTSRCGDTGEPEEAYLIDERFLVDKHGVSHYYDGYGGRLRAFANVADDDDDDGGDGGDGGGDDGGDSPVVNMNEWEHLCLVAENGRRGRGGDDGPAVKVPGKGALRMTAVTQMVVAKIAFLLHPANDEVFLSQLPGPMRASVLRMIKDGDAY